MSLSLSIYLLLDDGRCVDVAGGCGSRSSSLDEEVNSTSSRDMNFSIEREIEPRAVVPSGNNNIKNSNENEIEMAANVCPGCDESGDSSCDDERTPIYRHSVTSVSNWSSSDEETEHYRERSSLFRSSRDSSVAEEPRRHLRTACLNPPDSLSVSPFQGDCV